VKIAEENTAEEIGVMDLGKPSLFAGPECHGVLIEIEEGGRFRFRCHTGHAYSAESLLAAFTESTEDTLWNAIRSIEETALLMQRLAGHLEKHQHTEAAAALSRKAEATRKGGNLVRQALIQEGVFSAESLKIPPDTLGQ
jgi:two-component system chemotaxis response regulator CheB